MSMKGFSLLECLITTLIMSMITLMCTLLIGSSVRYQKQIQSTATAHMALTQTEEMLRHILQGAGYMGCRTLPLTINHANLLGSIPNTPIIGTPSAEQYLAIHRTLPQMRGDCLIIQTLDNIADVHSNDHHTIRLTSNSTLSFHTTYVITDCLGAEAFRIRTQIHNALLTETPLARSYGPHAQLGILRTYAFYVGNTHRKNPSGNTITALFKQSIDTPTRASEWEEGITHMSVQYASTLNPTFVSGDQVSQWDTIRAMRITLCAEVTRALPICHSMIVRPRYDAYF